MVDVAEVKCDHPTSTKDGFIEVSNFRGSYVYGSRATYHCNPGYILWGNSTRWEEFPDFDVDTFDSSKMEEHYLFDMLQAVRQLRRVDGRGALVSADLLRRPAHAAALRSGAPQRNHAVARLGSLLLSARTRRGAR